MSDHLENNNRKRRLSESDAKKISRPAAPSNIKKKRLGQGTPSSGSSTMEWFDTELAAERAEALRETIRTADVTRFAAVPTGTPSLQELEKKLAGIGAGTSALFEPVSDSSGCQTPEIDAAVKDNVEAKVTDWLNTTESGETQSSPPDDPRSASANIVASSHQAGTQSNKTD